MIKEYKNESEIIFILENLREDDKQELIALYGENWLTETLNDLKYRNFYVLYGYDYDFKLVPIAIGGFCECFENDKTIACCWLLSSFYIQKNRILFFKSVKRQIKDAEKKYKILYNFIHKTNFSAKKWLKKFGFKFDNPKPNNIEIKDGFEFFYKLCKKG